jgi:polar amino acid transport system permease protein
MRASALRIGAISGCLCRMEFLFDRAEKPASAWAKAAAVGGLALAYSALCFWIFSSSVRDWEKIWNYQTVFLNGWLTTIGISAAALVLSTLFGVGAALARRSSFLPLKYSAVLYVETIRGLPLMFLVLFGFYGVAFKLGWNDRLSAGMLILSLFSGAYIAEIIRSGIESVGRSQWDSARAIGLTPAQTYRLVIFPQVLRQTLPPLAGQFSSLIKDSSLLYIVGVPELTFAAQQVSSATFSTFEAYLPLGIFYLILTLPVSLWTKSLEQKARYES